MLIEIISLGSGLSLQDVGRCGWRRYGVPSGGAMDRRSMHLANILLGNRIKVPVLELVQQGARLRILRDTWLAIAGADFCSQLSAGCARHFRAGDILEMDQKASGTCAYLAAPGGFRSKFHLGSASSDPRNGLGQVLHKGTQLDSVQTTPNISTERVARRISSAITNHIVDHTASFELHTGPQFELFSAATRRQFIQEPWQVSRESDRTGYRLKGSVLKVPQMIPSDPVLPGSFQVPGSGQPIITMADGPTVGGYAKIAVLKAQDLDRLAQCAPGTKLKFTWLQ